MKFRFTYLNDGYYKIENLGSNKVMQAVDNSSNCNVQQSGWDESSRQKWKLTLYNDDFVISPKSYPSSCITISSGNVGDLESIKITPFHESNYQKWNIIPLEIPEKVNITNFYSNNSECATIKWNLKNNSDGYQAQIAQDMNFTIKTQSTYTTSDHVIFSGLSGGKNYYGRVQAYRKIGTKKYYGNWNDIPCVMVLDGKPIAKATLKKVTSPSKKKISIQWEKLNHIDNYEIQISKEKDFSSHTIRRAFSKSTTSTSVKGLSSKNTFYIRIRGCKKISGVNTYGPWSNIKQVKIK